MSILVGCRLGFFVVGNFVGEELGLRVITIGLCVGSDVGLLVVGSLVGLLVVGSLVGLFVVGVLLGGVVGNIIDGLSLGRCEGSSVGADVGLFDGFIVGSRVPVRLY